MCRLHPFLTRSSQTPGLDSSNLQPCFTRSKPRALSGHVIRGSEPPQSHKGRSRGKCQDNNWPNHLTLCLKEPRPTEASGLLRVTLARGRVAARASTGFTAHSSRNKLFSNTLGAAASAYQMLGLHFMWGGFTPSLPEWQTNHQKHSYLC